MDVVLHLANGASETYATTETVKLYPKEDLPDTEQLVELDNIEAQSSRDVKEPKGKKRP